MSEPRGPETFDLMPTKDELKPLKDLAGRMAASMRQIIEAGRDPAPVAAIVDVKGDVVLAMLLFSDQDEKKAIRRELVERSRRMGTVALVVVADAWARHIDTTEPGAKKTIRRLQAEGLEDDPDRTEAICCDVFTPRSQWHGLVPYTREAGGIAWGDPRTETLAETSEWDPWPQRARLN